MLVILKQKKKINNNNNNNKVECDGIWIHYFNKKNLTQVQIENFF